MPNPAADSSADTAAAMLQALRSADMNNQPLAEGLVDALDELLARSLEPESTYARLGIIANMTPAEAAWEGHLTLEFSNSSGADCRIYAGEGICQVLFFEGEPCDTTYADRAGKYQGQDEAVVVAQV